MEFDNNNYQNLLSEFHVHDYEEWKKTAEASLNGKTLDEIIVKTYEDIELKAIYTKDDLAGIPHLQSDYSGLLPNQRGFSENYTKPRKYYISQRITGSSPEEFNHKAIHNIKFGQTALKIKINESDNNLFKLDNLNDFIKAFKDIDLTEIQLNFEFSSNPQPIVNLLLEYLDFIKFDKSKLKGGIDYDPIAFAVSNGFHTYKFDQAFDDLAEMLNNSISDDFYIIGFNGEPYKEGGSSIVQELAFTISTSVVFIREMLKRNINLNTIIKKGRFTFTTGSDFFMEIAKIRAFRILWSNILKGFDSNLDSTKPNIYIKSTNVNKSKLDIYVNQLRNTNEILSAILSGCETIETGLINLDSNQTNVFEERLSRNNQIVLIEECNLKDVIDPGGGSYYIEYLTDQLARKAWKLFQEVELYGGMIKSLQSGFPQSEIQKTFNDKLINFAKRKDLIVGVNKFPNLSDQLNNNNKNDIPIPENNDIERIIPIPVFRPAEIIENIRFKSQKYVEINGLIPQAFLATFGHVSQHRKLAEYVTEFFHIGGFETIYEKGFDSIEEAVNSYFLSNKRIIVLCSSDDNLVESVTDIIKLIRSKRPDSIILLAGYPKDQIENYKKAGIDEFIHHNSNIINFFNFIQLELGMV